MDDALRTLPARVRAIVAEEAAKVGLQPAEIMQRTSARKIARTRWRVWRRQRNECKRANGEMVSKSRIGQMWGFDHTTVMHGLDRIEELEPS